MKTGSATRRQVWLRAGQIILSISLAVWLILSIAWADVLSALLNASPLMIGIGVLVYYFGVAISCLKWRLTLQVEGISLPITQLTRWYLIGSFMSNFLPTDIGGDLGRGYFAARQTGRGGAVARSIVVERLSGLMAMLGLAWLGTLVLFPDLRVFSIAGALIMLGCAGGVLYGALRSARLRQWLAAGQRRLPERVRNAIAAGRAEGGAYLRRPGILVQIALISLGFQALAGVGLWINLSAVGLTLPIGSVILIMALVSVVTLLPISVNGWGVREGALVSLLALLGAPAAQVLAGALLSRVLVLLVTLPGGILFLTTNPLDRPSRI